MVHVAVARLGLSLFVAALVVGCAGDPIRDIKEFVTTPIIPVPPKNQPATTTASAQTARKEYCDKLEFTSPLNVDSAYVRAMRNFGFRTTEERKRYAERNSMGMIDEGFRHTAQPGAMYRMADYNRIVEGDRRHVLWTSMELWREAPQQTAVKVDFCTGKPEDSDSTKAFLRKAYRDAFK